MKLLRILLPCGLLLATLCGAPAWANNLTVTNTLDETTTLNGCSLREAITNANNDALTFPDCPIGFGGDTIGFSVSGTITLGSTLPNITSTITIDGIGQNVTVSGNNAVRVLFVQSGGFNLQNLTVANGNSGGADGGGVANLAGNTLTITNTTFKDNHANSAGGGIVNFGILEVRNSTFSGNNVGGAGGGIYNNGGDAFVANSTFSSNSAVASGSGSGGGIANANDGGLHLIQCTFSDNRADGDSASFTGGGSVYDLASIQMANTILANSVADEECVSFGIFTPQGTNLVEDGTCDAGALAGDPNLGSLADNGGPTLTHALLTTPTLSTAIDAASVCGDAFANIGTDDQRGQPRPVDGNGDSVAVCDIGSYELQVASSFVFTGFFSPVDNPPTVNTAKAGQSIPVKFSLDGDHGLDIFAAGYPSSAQIGCNDGMPDAIEVTVSAGASGLSYDPATDTYTYVWKTQKPWKGQCRRLTVRFNDDSDHTALFQF